MASILSICLALGRLQIKLSYWWKLPSSHLFCLCWYCCMYHTHLQFDRMAKRSQFKGVIDANSANNSGTLCLVYCLTWLFPCLIATTPRCSSSDEILFISTSRKFGEESATINPKHNGIASNNNCSSIYGIYWVGELQLYPAMHIISFYQPFCRISEHIFYLPYIS